MYKLNWLTMLMAVSLLSLSAGISQAANLDDLVLNELWMGEEITKDDLKDHVVVIYFWGIHCGRCQSSAPQVINWFKKYGPQGLILLGIHKQNGTREEIVNHCQSQKITYHIYSQGSIKGVTFENLLPHYAIFDHRGALVLKGELEDIGIIDKKIGELITNMPDPLIGEGPYKKLKHLAQKVKTRKELGQVLFTLKDKHLNSEDSDEKSEAEQLTARLTRYADKLIKQAEKKKQSEPFNAFNIYQEVAVLFKGDEIGEQAGKILDGMKEDKTFQENMQADKKLAEIVTEMDKFKPCNKCAAFKQDCPACQKKNAGFESVMQKARALVKKYPDSPAAVKVKERLPLN